MGINQGAAIRLFVCVTPLVTGWGVATAPALGVTLASSSGIVRLNNFSHTPLDVSTLTDTKTFTTATNSLVIAEANANASFQSAQADNTSFSTTRGEGSDYLGRAQSQAAVIAYNFTVGEGETFSFDFNDSLLLTASIDSPEFEQASAEGDLSLKLYDSTNSNNWSPLEFLNVYGKLTAFGEDDALNINKSSSISFNPQGTYFNKNLDGNQEVERAHIEGSLSRTFDRETNLTLVEVKTNQTSAQAVPEPSNVLGILFFGLIGIKYRVKRRIFKLRP